jgi:CHASE3 domain sensor protein
MGRIQNLRIGTKLAITSLLTILLIGGMIFAQMNGNAAVRHADEAATIQQTLAARALEAKASVRGMMVGVRDLRLATSTNELQAAQDYLGNRHRAAQGHIADALKLSKSPENHARIEKMSALADDYLNRAAREIITVQKEAVGIDAKRDANGVLAPDLEERLLKLHAEVARIAREVGLPMARELEELSNKVVDFAKHRLEEDIAEAQQAMSSAERNAMVMGLVVALS